MVIHIFLPTDVHRTIQILNTFLCLKYLMHLPISFFTLLFDHTAIFNFIVLIFFVLLFDRCLLVTFGDFVVVPMTPSESRGYQIENHSGPHKIILPVLDIACR